ncbi:acyltransferase family protein [Cyclobacteriaceae bacterium]|nr:acyltransferase family protein [Cyclobacteriaceae bacterium]
MGSRESWVDYAKSIGIMLIVFGHLPNTTTVVKFLWTFHVPLFFFISGYLFSEGRNTSDVLKKTVLRLIIPYFVMYISLELIDVLHGKVTVDDFQQSMKAMFYGSNTYPGFVRGQMWFFPSIISVSLLFFFVIRRFPYLYIIPLAASIYIYSQGWVNMFLSVDLSLLGLNFYIAGYFCKKYDVVKLWQKMSKYTLFVSFVVLFFIVLDFAKSGNVWYGGDRYMFSYIGGVFGIMMVCVLAQLLSTSFKNNMAVRFVSDNTLMIMAFHTETYRYGNLLFGDLLSSHQFVYNLVVMLIAVIALVPVIFVVNWLVPELVGIKRKPFAFWKNIK